MTDGSIWSIKIFDLNRLGLVYVRWDCNNFTDEIELTDEMYGTHEIYGADKIFATEKRGLNRPY